MTKIIQPRSFDPRKTITVLAVLGIALYLFDPSSPPPRLWKLTGNTMGTTYSIKVIDNQLGGSEIGNLQKEIDELLVEVNRQMSTYITNSEISTLNQSMSTEAFAVSPGFATVSTMALDICRDTAGAFNPTLDRLISAWGFGPDGPQREPDAETLARDLALVGCDRYEVANNTIAKKDPAVTLNLNAIAKGWGVDEVARHIEARGITNYFIEIGGEVYARGQSEKLRPWRVGIDRPVEGAAPGEAFDLIVHVDGRGLATSGSYRNFFISPDGKKINHILDPRTGYPATTALASVSVIASNCARADALATGLFVMGAEEGKKWVDAREDIEAAFIEYQEDGTLKTTMSEGFSAYLVEQR